MKKTWQLQEAKGQFCSVAEKAADGGPQLVTKHGRPFVYIIGAKDWNKARKRPQSLIQVLRACPGDLSQLDLDRSRDLPREVSL